jgi:hypothetical protein
MPAVRELLARNATSDGSLYCLTDLDSGRDKCGPTHRRCHPKSVICGDCSGLAGFSISRIYGVCGLQAHPGSCIAV